MPYTTVVAGTTITAGWSNTNNRDQVVTPFASAAARDSAITSPVDGMHAYLTDTNKLTHYNGTAWVPAASNIVASQTLTAASSTFSASGATDFSISSVVVRVERLYLVHFHSAYQILAAPGRWTVQLFVDGVDTDRLADASAAANIDALFSSGILWTPTSGTKTIEARVNEVSGTSTLQFTAAATATRQFFVEDIGPR